MNIGYDSVNSPIGVIHAIVNESGVYRIELFEEDWERYIFNNKDIKENKRLCSPVITQLEEYFNGTRKEFDLPLYIEGTAFRKMVWEALINIPYGEVRSYKDIAEAVGNSKAVRAVGQANKANPIPIIIPCHRVIGKCGKLVGFAGNRTPAQRILLEHEGYIINE